MKSRKEEKLHEASKETRTLQESNKPYTSDYEIDNYIKAYRYARMTFNAPLRDLYIECCGPESKYHLDIDAFGEAMSEAFKDALDMFLKKVKRG